MLATRIPKGGAGFVPNPNGRVAPEQMFCGTRTSIDEIRGLEEDSQWKHVIHCAPCYQEFLDLRESCRLGDEAKVHRESQ